MAWATPTWLAISPPMCRADGLAAHQDADGDAHGRGARARWSRRPITVFVGIDTANMPPPMKKARKAAHPLDVGEEEGAEAMVAETTVTSAAFREAAGAWLALRPGDGGGADERADGDSGERRRPTKPSRMSMWAAYGTTSASITVPSIPVMEMMASARRTRRSPNREW